MLKKRQNEVKRNIFLFDEVKKNRSAIIAGWEDEAAIKNDKTLEEKIVHNDTKNCLFLASGCSSVARKGGREVNRGLLGGNSGGVNNEGVFNL